MMFPFSWNVPESCSVPSSDTPWSKNPVHSSLALTLPAPLLPPDHFQAMASPDAGKMNLQFTPARRLVKAPRRASCLIGNPRVSPSPAFHPCIVMEPAPLALKNSMKGAKPRGAEGRDAFAFSRAKHVLSVPDAFAGRV